MVRRGIEEGGTVYGRCSALFFVLFFLSFPFCSDKYCVSSKWGYRVKKVYERWKMERWQMVLSKNLNPSQSPLIFNSPRFSSCDLFSHSAVQLTEPSLHKDSLAKPATVPVLPYEGYRGQRNYTSVSKAIPVLEERLGLSFCSFFFSHSKFEGGE